MLSSIIFNDFEKYREMQYVRIETGNFVKVLVPFLNSEQGTTKKRSLNISDKKK